ncbi:RNA polymerase sigma factor [Pseudoneobacillus sp. C159]
MRGLRNSANINYNDSDAHKLVLEWYELYYEDVYRFIYFMLGDRQSCEDLVHDTFVRAFTSSSNFENRSSIKTWLFGIAKHIVIDEIRKRKRRSLFSLFSIEKEIQCTTNVEELIETKESIEEILQAIQKLKPNYRLVVTLVKMEECPTKEIAEILNWSETKVRKTLSRALQELRKSTNKGGDLHEGKQQQSI